MNPSGKLQLADIQPAILAVEPGPMPSGPFMSGGTVLRISLD
jgi:hypothetical protein